MTIEQLREQGYDVRVYHRRMSEADYALLAGIDRSRLKRDAPNAVVPKSALRKAGAPIAPRGGFTRVEILKGEEVVADGEAWCNPGMDNFNKQIGRTVALGRALKKLPAGVH